MIFLLSFSSILLANGRKQKNKWKKNLNGLKLPYQRNNPFNPQKKKEMKADLIRLNWNCFSSFTQDSGRDKETTTTTTTKAQNHGQTLASIFTSKSPWASTPITHKLPLNHTFITPQKNMKWKHRNNTQKSYYDNFWRYTFLMPTFSFSSFFSSFFFYDITRKLLRQIINFLSASKHKLSFVILFYL